MNEEEAFRNYCSAMVVRVRNKQTSLQLSGTSRRRRELKQVTGRTEESRDRSELSLQPNVPLQLIAMLKMKTLNEKFKRAAEEELCGPCVCRVCEERRAPAALTAFIRRKKTQLQLQTLKDRLNTDLRLDSFRGVGLKSPRAFRCPSLDLGGTSFGENMRVTATWGCLSNH